MSPELKRHDYDQFQELFVYKMKDVYTKDIHSQTVLFSSPHLHVYCAAVRHEIQQRRRCHFHEVRREQLL